MKTIKKLIATVTVLAILGTGSAIPKITNSKTSISLTAHAEFAHNCTSYKVFAQTPWELRYTNSYELSDWINGNSYGCYYYKHYTRITYYYCSVCGKEWNHKDEYKLEEEYIANPYKFDNIL
jgi:hypothetical protein